MTTHKPDKFLTANSIDPTPLCPPHTRAYNSLGSRQNQVQSPPNRHDSDCQPVVEVLQAFAGSVVENGNVAVKGVPVQSVEAYIRQVTLPQRMSLISVM